MNSKWNLKPSCSVRAAHRMFSTSPGEAAQGDDSYSHLSLAGVAKSAGRLMARLLVLLVGMAVAAPTPSYAAQIGVGVTIRIGPPPLPVYAQPLCPGPGYIWTPGYWAYDPVDGYYWVPGTWVVAPAPGVLWTPGYWGWDAGVFLWHAGYWGPHVGFYGGVNYGFGYAGVGYEGGYWRGRNFFYNRTVNNVNVVNVTNVYNRTVVNNVSTTRVSYNGGPGGLGARPAPGEMAAEHDRHIQATSLQQQHQQAARQNRAQFASVNHGKPNVVATARPGQFQGVNAVRGGGPQRVPSNNANRGAQNNLRVVKPNANPGGARPATKPEPQPQRNYSRPQAKTPGGQSQPQHSMTPRGATPQASKAGGPRPQAQPHNQKPAEEPRPQEHETERRR